MKIIIEAFTTPQYQMNFVQIIIVTLIMIIISIIGIFCIVKVMEWMTLRD